MAAAEGELPAPGAADGEHMVVGRDGAKLDPAAAAAVRSLVKFSAFVKQKVSFENRF
jgi:hypothetical protein